MIIDRIPLRADAAEAKIETTTLNLLHLANAFLDSTHPRLVPQVVVPERTEAPKDRLVTTIANVARGAHSQAIDWELRDIFVFDLQKKWWQGDGTADAVNERLERAGSPYRVQMDGPLKTRVEPPYGANVYHYLLTVADLEGKALNKLEMDFVKDDKAK